MKVAGVGVRMLREGTRRFFFVIFAGVREHHSSTFYTHGYGNIRRFPRRVSR